MSVDIQKALDEYRGHRCYQVCTAYQDLAIRCAELARELAELRADKERLDWLDNQTRYVIVPPNGEQFDPAWTLCDFDVEFGIGDPQFCETTLREVIDVSRKEATR